MVSELKAFFFRGSVIDLAVAVVIGATFGAITNSLVADVITPAIGALFGRPDFSKLTLGPIMIGNFINTIVNFLFVGTALFFVVKAVNKLMPPPAPEAAPAGPTHEELLAEIRDLLKASK
jgi:large conductance mechanosensitive channel